MAVGILLRYGPERGSDDGDQYSMVQVDRSSRDRLSIATWYAVVAAAWPDSSFYIVITASSFEQTGLVRHASLAVV